MSEHLMKWNYIVSDFVQNLVTKKQHIEAVRFICAYKLADKIQPVNLLQQYMERLKQMSERYGNKKSTETKVLFSYPNSTPLSAFV